VYTIREFHNFASLRKNPGYTPGNYNIIAQRTTSTLTNKHVIKLLLQAELQPQRKKNTHYTPSRHSFLQQQRTNFAVDELTTLCCSLQLVRRGRGTPMYELYRSQSISRVKSESESRPSPSQLSESNIRVFKNVIYIIIDVFKKGMLQEIEWLQ